MQELKAFSKKINWHIVVLVILFLTIRLPYFDDRFKFEMEQADDFRAIQSIWGNIKTGKIENLSVVGQEATIPSESITTAHTPIYHGVFYYYLHLPFAVLSNFSPTKLMFIKLFFELAAVIMLYLVGTKLLHSRTSGLMTAFLYSSLFWSSVYSRYIWTPSTVPIFAIFTIYGLVFWRRSRWMLFLAALASASASQVQFGAYWLVIYLLVYLGLTRVIFSWKNIVPVLLGLLIPTWPSLIHEGSNGFLALSTLTTNISFTNSLFDFANIFHKVTEAIIFGESYFYSIQPHMKLISYVGVLTIFAFAIIPKNNHPIVRLSYLLYIPFPYLISKYYLIADPNSYSRVIEMMTPIINNLNYMLPFFALGMVMIFHHFLSRKIALGLVFSLMLGFVVFTNYNAIARNFYNANSIDYDAGDKIFVAKALALESKELAYSLETVTTSIRDDEWVYLLGSYTNRMPERFNQKVKTGHDRYPVLLGDNPTELDFVIVDRRYGQSIKDNSWRLVVAKGVYELWSKNNDE